MAKAQYFIDMPVMGQLLGVLWILTIVIQIDNRTDPEKAWMYEHSYGNRLRKNLIDLLLVLSLIVSIRRWICELEEPVWNL